MIFRPLGQPAFTAHDINQIFTFTCFASILSIFGIIDDVSDFMKNTPPDVEGVERRTVAHYVREVCEINLDYEDRRVVGNLLFPSSFNHTTEDYVLTIAGFLQQHDVPARDCVREQLTRRSRAANGR